MERINQVDKLTRVNQAIKQEADANEKKYMEASKRRLIGIIEKKLQTAFIGALSKFENSRFGDLWGVGLDESEKTDEQLDWSDIWAEVRNEVLNNGNRCIRSLQSEMTEFECRWNRKQLTLPIIPRTRNP